MMLLGSHSISCLLEISRCVWCLAGNVYTAVTHHSAWMRWAICILCLSPTKKSSWRPRNCRREIHEEGHSTITKLLNLGMALMDKRGCFPVHELQCDSFFWNDGRANNPMTYTFDPCRSFVSLGKTSFVWVTLQTRRQSYASTFSISISYEFYVSHPLHTIRKWFIPAGMCCNIQLSGIHMRSVSGQTRTKTHPPATHTWLRSQTPERTHTRRSNESTWACNESLGRRHERTQTTLCEKESSIPSDSLPAGWLVRYH